MACSLPGSTGGTSFTFVDQIRPGLRDEIFPKSDTISRSEVPISTGGRKMLSFRAEIEARSNDNDEPMLLTAVWVGDDSIVQL